MKEKIKTADFHRLKDMCLKAARRKYGYRLPVAIRRRLTGEFREICQLDAAAFYLTAADLAGALREKGIMFYIDSPATSTLTAYLTGLTEIDPLPPHYSCPVCGRTSFISEEKDGRLLYPSMGETEPRACSICGTMDRGSGFDIPDGLAHAGEGIPKKLYRLRIYVQEDRMGEATETVLGVLSRKWADGFPHIVSIYPDSIMAAILQMEKEKELDRETILRSFDDISRLLAGQIDSELRWKWPEICEELYVIDRARPEYFADLLEKYNEWLPCEDSRMEKIINHLTFAALYLSHPSSPGTRR